MVDISQATSSTAYAFRRVIVASEGGSHLEALTRSAIQLAEPRARVRLIDMICDPLPLCPDLSSSYPDWRNAHTAMMHGAAAVLSNAARNLSTEIDEPETELIDLSLRQTNAARMLINKAYAWNADFIAISARLHESRRVCCLDPEEVASETDCPVLYVPSNRLAATSLTFERALVAVDGSDISLEALRIILGTLPSRSRLHVVYVTDRAMSGHAALQTQLVERHGFKVVEKVCALLRIRGGADDAMVIATEDTMDDVGSAIVREADRWQADLIVIGLHGGRYQARKEAGSVTRHALRHSPIPLLVCPRAHRSSDAAIDEASACSTQSDLK